MYAEMLNKHWNNLLAALEADPPVDEFIATHHALQVAVFYYSQLRANS